MRKTPLGASGLAPAPAKLRREKPRGHARHNDQCAESVVVRYAGAQGEAGNFRLVPRDGKSNGRISQHAEVVPVMRVLPDVLAVDNQIASYSLL